MNNINSSNNIDSDNKSVSNNMDTNIIKDGIYIPSIEACWLYKAKKENDNYKVDKKYLDKLLKGKLDFSFELIFDDELINNIEIKQYKGYKKTRYYTLDIVNVKFTKKYKRIENKKVVDELTTKELRDWAYDEGFMFNSNKLVNFKRSSGKARIGDCLFLLEVINQDCLDWARMDLEFTDEVDIAGVRAYESLSLSSIIGFCKIKPENILVIDDYESVFDWELSKTWLENGKLKTDTVLTEERNSIWDGQGILSNKIFDKNKVLKGKSFGLLRNRLTKCAAFSCNLEQFFRDYYGDEYETAEVKDIAGRSIKVKNIHFIMTPNSLKIAKFNDEVLKKEGYENLGEFAWLYYYLDHCGEWWGVCHVDEPSYLCKIDDKGNVVEYRNRMSYQHLNSISFTESEIKELIKPEIEYIERLKSDLNFFLEEAGNGTESNYFDYNMPDEDDDDEVGRWANIDVLNAFTELAKVNPDFANTQVFKDYRRNFIDAYKLRLRTGKIKVTGADYTVACGNPLEMLYSSVGAFKGQIIEGSLEKNELYCSRFDGMADGTDIIGFRNPHVNSGNIGKMKYKYVSDIKEYFNPSGSIVFLNSIDYPTLSLYQGEDFDSDENLLVVNPIIVQAVSRMDQKSNPIPVNGIKSTGSNKQEMTAQAMSDIDHIISQNYIGEVVNLSQEINSLINHNKNNNIQFDEEGLYNRTSRLSSLSCVEIDKAKRQFSELNIPAELQKMKNGLELIDDGRRIKPYFFKYVGDNEAKKKRRQVEKAHRRELDRKTIKIYAKAKGINIKDVNRKDKELKAMLKLNNKVHKDWVNKGYKSYATPMDWINEELDKVKNSKKVGTIQVISLVKKNKNKPNMDVVDKVVDIIRELNFKIKGYRSDEELDYKDREEKINKAKTAAVKKIRAMKLTRANLYWVLRSCLNSVKNNGKVDKKNGLESIALEILFKVHGSNLMEMFFSTPKKVKN